MCFIYCFMYCQRNPKLERTGEKNADASTTSLQLYKPSSCKWLTHSGCSSEHLLAFDWWGKKKKKKSHKVTPQDPWTRATTVCTNISLRALHKARIYTDILECYDYIYECILELGDKWPVDLTASAAANMQTAVKHVSLMPEHHCLFFGRRTETKEERVAQKFTPRCKESTFNPQPTYVLQRIIIVFTREQKTCQSRQWQLVNLPTAGNESTPLVYK